MESPSGRGGLLTHETVVVTGGASGIGLAITNVALREGARVIALDVDDERLTNIPDAPANLLAVHCDVTSGREVGEVIDRAAAMDWEPTVLINNAGRDSAASITSMTESEWDAFFDLDLKSAWLCARRVVPAMMERRRGAIVNLASVHAHLTAEGSFPYAAAKSGILGLTRSMALDLGPHGIRVNSVSPGYTRTARVENYLEGSDPGLRPAIDKAHALRRIGEPSEIAEVVIFLASDRTSFVTGADWIVDGGISARYA
jgi:NAD(P)-dependent dehydrogenase (short-subunit alcohol dehydrogenase family)